MSGTLWQRGSPFSIHVHERARELVDSGYSSKRVADELARLFPDEPTPGDRTLRNWSQKRARDKSGAWTVMSGSPDEAKRVLGVLVHLVPHLGDAAYRLSDEEAQVIARLAIAAADMPPLTMLRWARRYLASDEEIWRESLNGYLIHSPWRDRGVSYRAAFDGGLAPNLLSIGADDQAWLPAGQRRRQSFAAGAVIRK